MKAVLRFICVAALCLSAFPARAAHTQARLVLADDTARAGDTVMAGIHLRMDPHWHTYWKNPGASGMATTVAWQLPMGIAAGPVEWPVPEKTPDKELTTYIYENEVVLLVPLKLAVDLPPGPLELKAKVSWLECETVCVLGSGNVNATLTIGAQPKPSAEAALLEKWQKLLPQAGDSIGARAWWDKAATESPRTFTLEWNSSSAVTEPDFFPDASEAFEVQPDTEVLAAGAGKVQLRKAVKKFNGDWPTRMSGVVVAKSGDQRLAYNLDVPLASAKAASASSNGAGTAPATGPATPSLLVMLLWAFLGGLILNVMPCVLPVIALKILGFVGQAREDPRRVRRLGLIYALGVLVSFLALAGMVIVVQAAGRQAGWGMQFANGQFVVVITVLVTLIALNLFGVFDINPGGRVLETAGGLASKHGAAGAFFNGLLAVVLGTSCTAPFLAGALGFAFTRPPGIILLAFNFVALGLAFPYLLLSFQPAWLKFLPKPGRWMERFKIVLGFPMLATAVWLFSLLPAYYGKRALWLGLFLIILALAAWVYGEFVQRAATRRGLGLAVTVALLLGGYFYAIEDRLRWRSPEPPAALSASLKESPDGIDWQPWSSATVEAARSEGQPVLVDFTADWCLNCQANKRIALEVPSVRAKLKEVNAVALMADYTREPDYMTAELRRYGRAGVPLVLVFPRNPSEPPIVLPPSLTPGIVLDALQKAAAQ